MDKRAELEQAVDQKVGKDEVSAQNNLPADFITQLTHMSAPRIFSWFAIGGVYLKYGTVPTLVFSLIVGVTLWKKFPVTIQEKEKTIFNFLLSKTDIVLRKMLKKLDKLYTEYMNW